MDIGRPVRGPAPVAQTDAARRRARTRAGIAATLLAVTSDLGCASPYLLTVEDVVCAAGENAHLVGKLEYRGLAVLNKGLEDRDLRFYVGDRHVGTDDTGDEGYATVKERFEAAGLYSLTVRFEDDRGSTQSAGASVFVWAQDRPVLVVDIDGTIAQTKKRYLLGDGIDRSQPLPEAAAVLTELADRFHVVYLTARPRELGPKTRDWLAVHGFPPGPLLTWDIDQYEFSATEYKKDRLDDLKDHFDYVTIGVGNADSDYEAYRRRKLFTILIDPEGAADLIPRGVRLPSWSAVRKLVAANPRLYDRDLSYKTVVVFPGGQ